MRDPTITDANEWRRRFHEVYATAVIDYSSPAWKDLVRYCDAVAAFNSDKDDRSAGGEP